MNETFLTPTIKPEDDDVERSLRPRNLAEFVGQARIKEPLAISLAATKGREEALDHVLLVGPPGLGKTSLAFIVREELGVGIRCIAGPALERKGDMAAILTSLEPAHSSVIPNIVSENQVLAANTLASITWSFCLAAGASLGGIAAVWLGRDAVFVLNAFSFLLSAWLIRRMSFAEPHAADRPPLRARELVEFTPILDGIRYIRRDPRLFGTVFVKGGLGLLGANNVLLPILGERVFPVKLAGLDHSRAALLGMSMLMGARGAGSLLGPLIGARWAGESHSRLRTGILAGFVIAAAGYVCPGASTSLAIAICAVVAAHAGSSTNWVFSSTFLQIYTEDRFRGRVFSADLGICMLVMSASSYLAGVAIDFGVPPRAFAVAIGLVMLVPAAAWAIALHRTRRRSL